MYKVWGALLYSMQDTMHYWTALIFSQASMLPCGTSCIGIIFGAPTQIPKYTLLIPSKHMHYWTALIFSQASMLPCGTSCIGIIFGAPTQIPKYTLLIPSKHMIINNDKQKTVMKCTIRTSHRVKY